MGGIFMVATSLLTEEDLLQLPIDKREAKKNHSKTQHPNKPSPLFIAHTSAKHRRVAHATPAHITLLKYFTVRLIAPRERVHLRAVRRCLISKPRKAML
jgi:hypothetical protein